MSEAYETALAIVCAHCPYKTTWKFQLDHHIQRRHKNVYATKLFHAIVEPEQYHCLCCGFKSYYKLGKVLHSLNHNDVRNNEDGQFHPDEKYERYYCDNCKHKGHSSLTFCKHNDLCKMIPNVLTTDAISSATSSANSIMEKRHIILKHAGSEEINWFNCFKCSYRGKSETNLKRHMYVHASADEVNWYNCANCSYRAKRKSSLKSHMLTHASADELNWYNYVKCSYRTIWRYHLKEHILTHATADEINWYNYAKCSYRSKRKGDLKRHMLNHATADEINWYNCAKCFYRSKRKDDLKRHIRTHVSADEINWYNCAKCSNRYTRKEHLMKHTKRSHV